ncbi:hypothetical protein [Sphingomonas sp.]|uniref:hypothetical protein n=1 Tax=Sphingomonas sp. TaxID=28214 RepID=UPI0035AE9FA2
MPLLDCTLLESITIGRDTRLQLTGRIDDVLYVYLDALVRHELGGVDGFHASAPSGIGRVAHVLALRDGDIFTIGPTTIAVQSVCLRIDGAQALRDIRLRIDPPKVLRIVRTPPPRRRVSKPARATDIGRLPCWS